MDDEIDDQLRALLARSAASPRRRANTDLRFGDGCSYYVRTGPRIIPPREWLDCLQLANLFTPEAKRRQGIFDRFLLRVRLITALPIYVELVHDPAFAAALERRGFRVVARDPLTRVPSLLRRD